jgi:hypothetical protein
MSFLTDLFQRKPGGTAAGNFLRGIVSVVTNGNMGTGAGMITQEQADIRDLTDSEFIAKYAKTKRGVPVAGVTPNPNIKSQDQAWNDAGSGTPSVFNPVALVQNYWMQIALIVVGGWFALKALKKARII